MRVFVKRVVKVPIRVHGGGELCDHGAMATESRFRDRMKSVLRDRVLDVATELVADGGWAQVRMGDVSARVGISRQTLYNEFGSKPALAEALVARETERFLAGVERELAAHDDLAEAIAAAVEFTLRAAAGNPLLRAILTATRGGAEELLPLLTTRSAPILSASTELLLGYARDRWPDLGPPDDELELIAESMVRLTVSHIVLPTGPPERTAAQLRLLVERLLAAGAEPAPRK
jgi:AcrR family transcriptional regulator